MKVLYIESKRKLSDKLRIDFNSLPKNVFLAYSIQYKSLAKEISNKLQESDFNLMGFEQVLGCTKLKSSYPILLIGSGKFHALNLALQNNVPIYIYSNGAITQIDKKEVESLKNNRKALFSKFLYTNNLGIIVSTKPGQNYLKKAEKFKLLIEKKYPEKKINLFISNNINLNELENFNIDLWINSACPGLINDGKNIINIDDLNNFLEETIYSKKAKSL